MIMMDPSQTDINQTGSRRGEGSVEQSQRRSARVGNLSNSARRYQFGSMEPMERVDTIGSSEAIPETASVRLGNAMIPNSMDNNPLH